MARRSTLRTYQLAARIWLTAALASLALPQDVRLGIWLPLHLAMAGAISVAISGAMQNFALTLSAAPDPPPGVVWAQFAAVNVGAALVAIGYPTGAGGIVVLGGVLVAVSAGLLGWLVRRARRIGLNKRLALPFAMYGAAVAAVLIGGTLGAVIGSGAVSGGEALTALRQAHQVLNVLGWVSLTIAGTLVTFLPTVLRIKMPSWRGSASGALLVAGVAVLALGLGLRVPAVATVGSSAQAAGAIGLGWMALEALRTPRRWPVPLPAKHLVCGLGWFLIGSLLLPFAILSGLGEYRRVFLAVFVCGWALQTLLGAWHYLLPMARPGHPDDRRRWLAAIETLGSIQVLALNLGILLLALAGADLVAATAARVGAGLALLGAVLALAKAWAFSLLAKVPFLARGHPGVWGHEGPSFEDGS